MKCKTVWTTENLIEYIKNLDESIEILGNYVNTQTNIECKCKKCNFVWYPKAGNLINDKSHCPKCAQIKKSEKKRIPINIFLKRLEDINPNVEILDEFISTKKQIKCRCKICGKIWSPIGESLLRGSGCSACAYKKNGKNRKTSQSDFVLKLSRTNPGLEVVGSYEGAFIPIQCKCKNCGHIWSPRPHDILMGSGCPECSHSATSFIEQFILKAFQKVLGIDKVLNRDKTAIGKELDIFVPSLNLAIEPGAWGLHKVGRKKDIEKKKLCKEKGIRLITIYYGCNEEFENEEDLIVYSHNFERESSFIELQNLVYLLFNESNIQYTFSDDEWLVLKTEAYMTSRKTTTKEFISRLKDINPNIIVLGEYKSSSERIKCQCKICGHVWNPQANSLIQERGCPKCQNLAKANNQRFNQVQFLQKIREKNLNIVALENYIDSKTKIGFKCLKCNYEWQTKPAILFRGHGCPNCAGRPKFDTNSFKKTMKTKNPNITIIGEYINTSTKIETKCNICSNIWMVSPHDLQTGRGCPKCANKKKGLHKTNKNGI